MTNNECKRILEYLDKNKLEELRKYVIREEHKEYLSNARKALNKYIGTGSVGFLQESGRLIITDTCSILILNNSDILTKNNKYKLQTRNKVDAYTLKKFCEQFASEEYTEAKSISSEDKYSIIPIGNKNNLFFSKKRVGLVETILGEEDRKYYYYIDETKEQEHPLISVKIVPAILQIETKKGKCYIPGRKDK